MSIALLFLAAAAPAERSDYSPHDTRKAIEQYGRCIIDKQHDLAAAAIVRNVDNATLMRQYRDLIDGRCMPLPPLGSTIKVKFLGDQFRYALADGLVRKDLLTQPAPVVSAIAPLDHREPTPPNRVDRKGRPLSERQYAQAVEGYEQAQAFAYVSRFGECVVRANPDGARALLGTVPDSAEERTAFAALSAALSNCLESGQKIEFAKLALRGTIAVNYYRLATAARTMAQASPAR
jgi:hypothetical protein